MFQKRVCHKIIQKKQVENYSKKYLLCQVSKYPFILFLYLIQLREYILFIFSKYYHKQYLYLMPINHLYIYIIYVLFIITNQLKVMFNQQQAVDSLLQYEEERREVKSQMSFSQNNFIQSEEIRQWDKNFENIDFMRRFSMQQITMLNLKKVSTKIDVKDVNNKDILVLSAEKQSRTNKNFYIRPKKTTRQREQYCISPQILIHNHRKDKKYSKEQHRVSSFVKEVKPQKEINQKPFFRVYNYPNKKPANINITNFPFSIPIHDNIDNEMKLNSQRQKYQSLMKKIHLCLNKRVQEQSLIEEKKMSIIPHLKAKKLKANYIKRRQLLL